MTRPPISNIKNSEELKRWYWLKEELINFCKSIQLPYTGPKFEILDRIGKALDSDFVFIENAVRKPASKSKFNWSKSPLSLDTIITDSYTNRPKTRSFFKEHCGDRFHFSIAFIDYMKQNAGKTLQDAVNEWKRLNKLSKEKSFKSEIPAGNQYNQYIRDFFADNPTLTLAQARHFWKLKRSLPLGKHVYEKSDLELE